MAGRHSLTRESAFNAMNSNTGRAVAAAAAVGAIFGTALPSASAKDAVEGAVASLAPVQLGDSFGTRAVTSSADAAWALGQVNSDVALSAQNVAAVGIEVAPLERETPAAAATPVASTSTRGTTSNAATGAASTEVASSAPSVAAPVSGSGSDVVNYALQFVGAPYAAGGSTPSGWDCSGFVRYVYSHFGISTPRTSGAIRSAYTVVSASEALPGDIVWWPGHVGIYAGNGMHVAATNPSKGTAYQSNYGNPVFLRVMN